MNFLDLLDQSIKEEVVVEHDFLFNYDPGNKVIHAFFEGKTDESFYGTFLRRFKPDGWVLKTYICGNKDSVYYQYETLNSRWQNHQPLLFFVDKDIDDIIPVGYVTSHNIFAHSNGIRGVD